MFQTLCRSSLIISFKESFLVLFSGFAVIRLSTCVKFMFQLQDQTLKKVLVLVVLIFATGVASSLYISLTPEEFIPKIAEET